ncbi:MAG: protein-L-isoaspartate(D-aspartate) O-methyltransferase [Actinobacteria bacterium]|nr:protein-L-isoaspartate(D-aspartate) O-methyltransferase [Actinomycetota bacterium]
MLALAIAVSCSAAAEVPATPGSDSALESKTTTTAKEEKVIESPSDVYTLLREEMVSQQIVSRGITDSRVIETMLKVQRHLFVDDFQKNYAYEDRPLPIGLGQTISQPYIVALMTENLACGTDDRVLEIGTGSGYQAAILAELVKEVYTVEILPSLYDIAKERLKIYPNVMTSNHDGYWGWEEYSPFDKIIVTAAPDHIPQPLVSQLKEGGIMIIPVGPTGWNQILYKVIKEDGNIRTIEITGVMFVPLTRENGSLSN